MLPRRSSLIALAVAATAAATPLRAQLSAPSLEPLAPAASAALAQNAPAQNAPAQNVPAPAPTRGTPAAAAPVGPALATAPVALRPVQRSSASLEQEQAALQARARSGFSQSQVLMIVGGVALITGLVIGDDAGDVLAIGGAGVGLFGLYRYLQGR